MNHVTIFLKNNCPLCDEVKSLLDLFMKDYAIVMEEIDIEKDEKLLEKYFLEVPVIRINGEELDYRSIDYFSIENRLH
ncbi:glutaredoxin family protein [Halobacillus salinus]|uniref:Glutaredoxin family protein n=1 Tax=Halobacillus salinus TaxID=192814 RepID=A0A4Z0GX26_9BACI|nr:glutaredoxin family protein [Halobacillus salinus]TGB02295.1 glutaredoxin family protein [Halobacillus salinus]